MIGSLPILHDLTPTDSGNAEHLWRTHGANFRYVVDADKFIVWNGQCWQVDDFNQMQEWAKSTARDILLEAHSARNSKVADELIKWSKQSRGLQRIRAATELVKSLPGVPVRFAELDTHPDNLAVRNGVYNLRTGKLEAPCREDLITQQLPIEARPGAPCPHWREFLDLLFDGDQEMIHYLRLSLGYCLTGSTTEQCSYIFYGKGNNGKSTLLAALTKILGSHMHHVPKDVISGHGLHNVEHHLADCRGKRLLYTEEFKLGDTLNEGLLNEITGGGEITAARK